MKLIDTKDAVGHVLCHDITQIIRGVTKDAAFRKGHIVREEDIPVLLSLGKDHLYVWEKTPGMLHENEAAQRLCALCINQGMEPTPVKEGKIELAAQHDGLFRVDVARLAAINAVDEVMIATRHTNTAVKKGDRLAGTRVIPLVIDQKKLEEAERLAGDRPLLELLPWQLRTAGIVTTGNEVYHHRIEDTFTPVIVEKLAAYGIEVNGHHTVDDDQEHIVAAIQDLRDKKVDVILCTGGMSVDPDDRTPASIRQSGAHIVSYGAPVLPGAMFLVGYFEDGTPILGLPGCVMYAKATVFDVVFPRIAAGVPVTKAELAGLGHGGLCLGCPECHYPDCSFGKGV